MTAEQIAAEIAGIGEDLPITIQQVMLQAVEVALAEIRANMPVDTGRLKSSLQATVNEGYVGISMEEYGWYQNYGVLGTNNNKTAYGVHPLVKEVLPPRQGDYYSFDNSKKMIGGDLPFGARINIHRYGITGKQFIDIEALGDRIAELTNQTLEL